MTAEPGAPLLFTHEPRRNWRLRLRRWLSRLFEIGPAWLFDDRAERRSFQLLAENLSPMQRQQYRKHRYFEVVGGRTGRRYRIRHGYQLNIEQLDSNGKRVRTLCFMPKGDLGVGDIMLAQKLALELFEDEAIKA